MIDTPIQWGLIPNNHWGPVEGATYGVGIIRTVPHLRFHPIDIPVSTEPSSSLLGLYQWHERDGVYVMDIGSRTFHAAQVESLEQLGDSLHKKPPKLAKYDKRVETLSYTIDQLLQKLNGLAVAGQPAGLVTPRNVVVITRGKEDFMGAAEVRKQIELGKQSVDALTPAQTDLLRRAEQGRSVVLPDLGFQFPLASSSDPSWLAEPHDFGFLWDRSPVEEHRAPTSHRLAMRSTSRLIAWALTGQSTAIDVGRRQELANRYGPVWNVLADAEQGGYETVAEFRQALQQSPVDTHHFDIPWESADAFPPVRTATPNRRGLGRFGKVLVPLLLVLLLLGVWVWWDWPRPVLNGLPRTTVTGAIVTADIRDSNGQSLAIRWGADHDWQEVSREQSVVRSQYNRAGQYEITLAASSRLLGFLPVSRETEFLLTVDEILRAINTPLTNSQGQFLHVETHPQVRTAPNDLLISLELPDMRSVEGVVSIGTYSAPIGVGRPVKYHVDEPGAYRIDWTPESNPYGMHGEFIRLRFLASADLVQEPVAGFSLTPNPVITSEVVHLDPSNSAAAPGHSIVGLDIDWGEGKGWQGVSGPHSLQHAYPTSGRYDVSLRVSDDIGSTALATRPLVVKDPLAKSSPPSSSEVEIVKPDNDEHRKIDESIRQKVADAGGKSGDVQISLVWSNMNDLDLHVQTSDGEVIYFGHDSSKCGGKLDLDKNVSPRTESPVENIYWKDGSYPRGPLYVFVHHYKNHGRSGCQDPTVFEVRVKVRERPSQLYRGSVTFKRDQPPTFVTKVKP